MLIDSFSELKTALFENSGFIEITEDFYNYAMDVLPPFSFSYCGFTMGEGDERYVFKKELDKCFATALRSCFSINSYEIMCVYEKDNAAAEKIKLLYAFTSSGDEAKNKTLNSVEGKEFCSIKEATDHINKL